MKFKQFCAVKTLNGNPQWWRRKWRFSLTKASAPTHSVYAAIKASADLKPFVSYFAPNSKGTKNSSSITVNLLIRIINSLNASGVKLLRTSSIINRVMRTVISLVRYAASSISLSQDALRIVPRANIYSLLSRMTSKSFLPKFFSGFADFVNYFLFVHAGVRRFDFRHNLPDFLDMLKRFFGFFHLSLPLLKYYYRINPLSMQIALYV